MMNYFVLALAFLNVYMYLFIQFLLFNSYLKTLLILYFNQHLTKLYILKSSFCKFAFSKTNTKITLVLINTAIIYMLFIRNLVIHTGNLSMHAFINYSHWSLGHIFPFALAYGYSSPHTPRETQFGTKT